MKRYFVVASCFTKTKVCLPSFKTFDEAFDYCDHMFKYPNEIKSCDIYSIDTHLTKFEGCVYNFRHFASSRSVDDNLPF